MEKIIFLEKARLQQIANKAIQLSIDDMKNIKGGDSHDLVSSGGGNTTFANPVYSDHEGEEPPK